MSETRVAAAALTDFVDAVLRALGAAAEDAARAAEVVVEADLRGVDSHGVRGLGGRIAHMRSGAIDLAARPTRVGGMGAMVLFDGHHGYGPALCSAVLDDAIDLVSAHGIGMALLRRSSHWGCPAYYARWMAARGFLGIAISNTNPAMPLWGSSKKSIGNNPIAIAAPRRGAEPIVLDISMQQISWGGLQIARDEGRRLPGPWGYDSQGHETDDPALIIESGRVRPMGDHKGSGLAFMLEILTGVLSAGAICYEVGQKTAEGEPAHYCQTFIAIKPDAFTGADGFLDKIDALYGTARKAPPAEGHEEVALPGDRSNALMAERRRHGIPIRRIRPVVERLSAEFQLPLPWSADVAG